MQHFWTACRSTSYLLSFTLSPGLFAFQSMFLCQNKSTSTVAKERSCIDFKMYRTNKKPTKSTKANKFQRLRRNISFWRRFLLPKNKTRMFDALLLLIHIWRKQTELQRPCFHLCSATGLIDSCGQVRVVSVVVK